MSDTVAVDFNNTKSQVEQTNRGRMKITFKLNKESAQSVKNFMDAIKPAEVTEEQFYTHVFFTGLETLNTEVKRMFDEQKGKLEEQKRLALAAENIAVPIINETKIEEPDNIIQGSFGKK